MGEVVTPSEFTAAAHQIRKQGRKVVFTNGVFDILHYGHVAYLQQARALGDALFVAVNTDASTRALKGDTRPLVAQDDRMNTLAALACVDYVTAFDEPTPIQIIEQTQPDILAKGADYAEEDIVGGAFVKARGGQVVPVPLLEGRSTTALIERIRQSK